MNKSFEVKLREHINTLLNTDTFEDVPTVDTLVNEIVKQFPSDYKNRSSKDLNVIVTNIYASIIKSFKKRQPKSSDVELPTTPSPNLKRSSPEVSESESKRLKVDEDSEAKTPSINSSNDEAIKDKTKTSRKIKDILNLGKVKSKVHKVHYPTSTLIEVEGIASEVLSSINDWLISLDDKPPYIRGILITGPEGCGKTLLAMSIAGEKKYPIISASALSLFRGFSDEKTENIRNLFAQAENTKPCFVLLEGIDSLVNQNKSSNNSDQNNQTVIREVIQEIDVNSKVFVIATARKLESVDMDLRSLDIFEQTLNLKLPDLETRMSLLQKFTHDYQSSVLAKTTDLKTDSQAQENMEVNTEGNGQVDEDNKTKVTFDVDLNDIAQSTPGFSGRNLKMLVKHAKVKASGRQKKSDEREPADLEVVVQRRDFADALKGIKSTVMNRDFVSIPKTTWQDIGALENVRQELLWEIMDQIKNPDSAGEDGLLGSDGVMLFGPPGCGKTLIAKAMANEAAVNFRYVKGPELIDKYVGESERNIRNLFRQARECSPCLIFFDEIDSISEKRSSDVQGGTKVVQQLLIELDGVENRSGVFVMGATNRIDCVDPAFLRGNRFGTKLYVGLPTAAGRLEILRCLTEKLAREDGVLLDADVDLGAMAERCEHYNGADLKYLIRKAVIEAKKEFGSRGLVCQRHLDRVARVMKTSVAAADRKKYESMAKEYGTN